MICTKCGKPIEQANGYCRTKKGFHHFACGVANLPDQPSTATEILRRIGIQLKVEAPSIEELEGKIISRIRENMERLKP